MKDLDLFQMALGLDSNWKVTKSEFSLKEKRLDIYLDFVPGTNFPCPTCAYLSKVHDTVEKSWRHLNFFQYDAYLHARVPRIKCNDHGVRMIQVPWANPGSGFTLLFEALILTLADNMPISAIAALVGETDNRIWRIVKNFVNNKLIEQDLSGVKKVGIDETSAQKGHRYVTVFVDMETHKVIFSTDGKDSSTIQRFMHQLARKGGCVENITEFSCDMSPAFIKGINDFFPDAKITYDKFHVVKLLNAAVDEVRKNEQRNEGLLVGSKYLWLKNERELTIDQKYNLSSLSRKRLATARAYRMKIIFQELYSRETSAGEKQLLKWYSWAMRSRLEPIKAFAKILKTHWDGVIQYFNSGLTNGALEGINSIIQLTKARARGYRSTRNFITMIYFNNAGFTLQPT